MEDNIAKKMCDKVAASLKENKWRHEVKDFKDGEYAVDTDVHSKSDVIRFYEIRMLFRKWDMQTIYYIPIKAPEAKRLAVAEYLTRINWRKKYGKFQMDFEDGEIRLDMVFSPAAVEKDVDDVLGDSLNMMCEMADRFAPGLMAVIAGGQSAKDAFDEAVKPKDEPPPDLPDLPDEPPPTTGDALSTGATATAGDAATKPVAAKPKKKRRSKKTPDAQLDLFETVATGGEDGKQDAPRSTYSLEGLNLEGKIPLEKIIAAVKKFRSGEARADVEKPRLSILLSGAPGSGKTAFAKYLAQEVGAPLRTVRASDLLSKWVGETEKKLAEIFSDAKEKGEILFLDECDSFLQSREGADHGWEVTQVNELLQQMEEFGGVMIAATNFSDRLDKAVMRRFTYKLKLDFLTDDGKAIFFDRYFKTPLTEEEKTRLNAISKLTPGDFRTVKEELFYLEDKQSNDARLTALEAEAEAKGKERGKIGF